MRTPYWWRAEALTTKISKTDVPISCSCTTTSLSGRSDRFYQFDVHIGLQPTSRFGEPYDPQPAKKPLLPGPDEAIVPGVGEMVTLPDGKQVKVIGMMTMP